MAQLKDLLVSGAARFLNGLNINGDFILAGNLLPAETNKYNLGDSNHRWLQTQTKYLSVGAGDISSSGYEAVISGDFHVTGYSIFDDYVNIGTSGKSGYKLYVNGNTYLNGNTYSTGPLFIGSDANGYGKNYIAFYGTTGDNPGTYTHTYIGENLWGGNESSELVLFKGNDIASQVNTVSGPGGDRIRHIAAGHLFQIYNSGLSGTFQSICQSTTPINVFEINKQGIMVTMQNDATFKVYANTNTSYGYETVSLQTAFDTKDPETSGYPASYGNRCTMLLQPLGGQVYIGSNLTTLADSNYKLYVNGNTNIQGQLKIYTNTLFAYDNTDQYLQYTGESYVNSHAGRIDLYRIIASGTAGTAGTKVVGAQLDAATGMLHLQAAPSHPSATAGARIKFTYWTSASDNGQPVYISHVIHDSYRGPYGLKIWGSDETAPGAWLEVEGNLYIGSASNSNSNDNAALYIRGMSAIEGYDTWIRLNDNSSFSSGTLSPKLIRSDEALQVGSEGANFYANSSGNGYIQNTFGVHGTDTTKHFFVNGTSRFADDITMDNGSEILFSTNTQYLRWTTDTSNNNSTGRSWYGIGTYQNTSDSNNSWLNISNYLGINITTKGTAYLRHNNNVIATTGNQTGTVGSATHLIYSSGGVLMASTATVGSGVQPIFLSSGNITASGSTVGSAVNPIFMSGGRFSASTASIGSGVRGVYLSAGAITPMSYELRATVNSGTANRVSFYSGSNQISSANGLYTTGGNLGINATTTTVNSTNYTLYVNGTGFFNGQVTATQFNGYLNGNAATATKFTSAQSITLTGDTTGTASSQAGWSIGTTTSKLSREEHLDTVEKLDGFIEVNKLRYATVAGIGGLSSDGMIISMCASSSSWGHQIFLDDSATIMRHRHRYAKRNSDGSTGQAWSGWATILDTYNYTETLDGNYVKKSGDTMTGMLQVNNAPIFGYRYGQSNNAPAFVFDKPSNHYTGIGTNGNADTIYFGAVTTDGSWNWVTSYKQKWVFNGDITADKVYGAVWNDYAEYRSTSIVNPGQCVIETGFGDLVKSTKRLQPGANIVSDTFGFAIGETEKTKTPLAVSGRVLAYPYEDRYSYSAGDPVCSGPNGTISKMTREEVRKYPDRIVGTVSEIPEYETWGTGNVKVDGRIWIKVR